MAFKTIVTETAGHVLTIQMNRREAGQTFNNLLLDEFHQALDLSEGKISVVLLKGLPGVFCAGADFKEILELGHGQNAKKMYDLWLRLAQGSFVSVAYVQGTVSAGGVGFVASCDIVLADHTANFCLSEMLFGLHPACVLPFLSRRIGHQRARYMTLTTQSVSVQQAADWGLVDAYADNIERLLHRHLLRLKVIDQASIASYKNYVSQLSGDLLHSRPLAVAENLKIFDNPDHIGRIERYMTSGQMPWEN